MNNLVKALLVAGGGFALYEWYTSQHAATPVATPGTAVIPSATQPATVSPTSGTATSTGAPVPDAKTIWDKFAAVLKTSGYGSNSNLTCDQWNYFYNQVAGANAAPDPMAGCVPIGMENALDRSMAVPYANWRSWMTSKGLGVWITRGNAPVQFSGLGAGIWGYGRGYVRQAN